MGQQTKIGWTNHTFNPVWGCAPVSAGCRNCYAAALARRWGFDVFGGANGQRRPLRTFENDYWRKPLSWNRKAEAAGERRRVFCGSMCDVFDDHPQWPEQRERLWELIRATPYLDWLLLTKRSTNMIDDYSWGWGNLWLGVTVENNNYVERAKILAGIRHPSRFVSVEPALGPVNDLDLHGIHSVIWGGESGPQARPADLNWARDLRDRCRAAGVPFFFKQTGGRRPGTGELLDGELIQELPKIAVRV